MLTHPTLDKLMAMKLTGMAKALREQFGQEIVEQLSFEERLGLLVDREMTERENRQLVRRLQLAHFREQACLEDLECRGERGLDRQMMAKLGMCQWLREHHDVLVTGATGVGKTYIACALGQAACREGYRVLYHRLPRLLRALAIARGDGSYDRQWRTLARCDLLLLDDWGLGKYTDESRRELLELVEERHQRRSTLVASQYPVEHWHELIGEPTVADAVIDRLVHGAYRIALKGESMRKVRARRKSDRAGREPEESQAGPKEYETE